MKGIARAVATCIPAPLTHQKCRYAIDSQRDVSFLPARQYATLERHSCRDHRPMTTSMLQAAFLDLI
jgi:hypothetical protein